MTEAPFRDRPLRLNVILPFASKTGGVIIVLEYARRLRMAGHTVHVYDPVIPYFAFYRSHRWWRRYPAYVKAIVTNLLRRRTRFSWHAEDVPATQVPWISGRFVADGDVVVATAWPTAYSVARMPSAKGRKAYFVQGYEIWSGPRARVDDSYRLPLHLVTIAPRLTAVMREHFGRSVVAEIHNAVDTGRFHPPVDPAPRPLTVLMMHHDLEVKGIPDGLAVLRRLHEAHPHVRFRLFGMPAFPEAEEWMEHHRNPSREHLVRLYQEADVFVSPSLAEGWHLPPMEAMACGCAVVATRVGCIPVLERDGNLRAVAPGDREGLFREVDALLRDADLRRETARKGLETIRSYTWDVKTRELEAALARIIRAPVNPVDLADPMPA